jgi:hypothetical protein
MLKGKYSSTWRNMCCNATCPLQIPRGLAWDRTQTLMVGGKCVSKVADFMEDIRSRRATISEMREDVNPSAHDTTC